MALRTCWRPVARAKSRVQMPAVCDFSISCSTSLSSSLGHTAGQMPIDRPSRVLQAIDTAGRMPSRQHLPQAFALFHAAARLVRQQPERYTAVRGFEGLDYMLRNAPGVVRDRHSRLACEMPAARTSSSSG